MLPIWGIKPWEAEKPQDSEAQPFPYSFLIWNALEVLENQIGIIFFSGSIFGYSSKVSTFV
jgi:hypothetical protein